MARRINQPAGRVPGLWRKLAEQRKSLVGWSDWPPVEPYPAPSRVSTDRVELRSRAAEIVETVIPLGDDAGIGLEGVRLRMSAWAYRRLHEVTATLEVSGGRRSFVNIARVDAWPVDPHFNTRARRQSGLRHVPLMVEGSHVHRFDDNARLGLSAFAPYSNLPVAVPIREKLTSFRDFARLVGAEFNIDGLDQIDPPEWQELI